MLSAFLVVKDAAALLPSAVASLRRLADEVLIVVDQASTDNTLAVARDLSDTFRYWAVDGSYESVLNQAAATCAGDWIIYGHDDELWPPALRAQLPRLMARGPQEWLFPRRHIVGAGREYITTEPWYPDWQLRLRSRRAWQAAPWPRRVHSSPPAYQRETCHIPIWHLKFAVKTAEARAGRLARWGEMWEPAASDHYRKFSLPEGYGFQTAPVEDMPPEELAAMLAATAETQQTS